jgi:hypothetical protein
MGRRPTIDACHARASNWSRPSWARSTSSSTMPASPATARMLKMTYQDWKDVMDTNLGGCFNMAKATFPGMRERGWGRIVNIGSINGQAGQYGQVNYAAAKSGIHGFTKALAQEGAKVGRHGQRDRAGLYRHRHGRRRAAGRAGKDRRPHPGRPPRSRRRKSPVASSSCAARMRASSPDRRCRSTAASTCTDGARIEGLLGMAGPVKRSVNIAGHATSITLEPVFWECAWCSAAEEEALPLNALGRADRCRADRRRRPAQPRQRDPGVAVPPGTGGNRLARFRGRWEHLRTRKSR